MDREARPRRDLRILGRPRACAGRCLPGAWQRGRQVGLTDGETRVDGMSGETVTGPAAGSQDERTRMRAGRPGGLSAIGGTPVVRLAHLPGEGCAEVWVKMEASNPTGS